MSRRFSARVIVSALAVTMAIPVVAQTPKIVIQSTPTTKPGSAPAPRRLTIDDAVATALANSKTLQIAAEAVLRAQGVVGENRAAYNPSLSATGTFTHLNTGSTITLPGENGQPQTITIVNQNQKALGLAATLPIDIAGLIRSAVEAAQFQEIATRLDYNRTRNQLVLDTKNAYFNVLRAKAFVTVSEVALTNARDRQTTAEAYLRAGTGTRFDVLRAQTDVANADQNLIAARNQVNLANATLANVLNLDQNTPIETVDVPTGTAPTPDFNASVSEAYNTRPEVFEAEANIRAAERGIRLAERSQLPTLGVAWNFNYQPDTGGFSPQTTSWAAVAQINVPIFDQGISRARVKEARATADTARINKQVTLDTVALDVRQNYLSLVEAQQRLNVTSAALTQAEEQYRLAQVRFRAGVTLTPGNSPLLEISDAQAALTQAQSNQVNAQYDLQNARARLDRAIGRYAFTGTPGYGLPAPSAGGTTR